MVEHIAVQNRLVASLGWLLHIFGQSRLACKGKTAKGVHNHIDPQHLHNRHGRLVPKERADHRHPNGAEIHRQLKRDELADVLKDAASVKHRAYDGGKVVVEDDDVAGILCHLRAATHRKPDVGAPQGGSVIDAVTRHSHNQSALLRDTHQAALIGWERTCYHGKTGENISHTRVGKCTQFFARQNNVALAVDDSCSAPDACGSLGTVARYHHYVHAGILQACHGFYCLITQGVLQAKGAKIGQRASQSIGKEWRGDVLLRDRQRQHTAAVLGLLTHALLCTGSQKRTARAIRAQLITHKGKELFGCPENKGQAFATAKRGGGIFACAIKGKA